MTDPSWSISRRKFVESLVLSGVAIQLPWLQSCENSEAIPTDVSPFSKREFLDMRSVLWILFPDDGNGPGAEELKADHYILWVLRDKEADPEEIDFLVKNTQLFSSEIEKKEGKSFHELSKSNQNQLLKYLLKETDWCERWSSRLLTLILEALLLDPQYGVNPNEKGWLWLEHNPGYPRPKAAQLYPKILEKKNEI